MIAEKRMASARPLPRSLAPAIRRVADRALTYIVVGVGGFTFIFPFVWAVLSSGKSSAEIASFPPTWWPDNNLFVQNYTEIWRVAPFGRWVSR